MKSYFLPAQDTFGRIRYVEGQLTINNKLFILILKKKVFLWYKNSSGYNY